MRLPTTPTPIVLAPMAGGPGTPELVAAVGSAGALGFLPSGYVDVDTLRTNIDVVRSRIGGSFGVNLFVPAAPDAERLQRAEQYVARLAAWAETVGMQPDRPAYTDDHYTDKLSLLVEQRTRVVSFTFGLPDQEAVDALHDVGSSVLVTVTNPEEASAAVARGADGLVAQGWEAGAHQGGWLDSAEHWSVLPLLQSLVEQVDTPLVAAGGIATGRAVAAVLTAGAQAAMLGTAFMRCPEAGTAPSHAAALHGSGPTLMTRAFTGRPARALSNELASRFDAVAPDAYPEVHVATSRMRADARSRDHTDRYHLWAGQAHALARAVPAADVVATLDGEARAALQRATLSWGAGAPAKPGRQG